MCFSAGKSALTKHNLAVAYNAGDMIIHGTANDSKVSAFLTLGKGGTWHFLLRDICQLR